MSLCVLRRPIICFRSQLPRLNAFYSEVAPDDDVPEPPIPSPVPVCDLCGIRGAVTCDDCRTVHYCSDEHRDLALLEHKKVCGKPRDENEIPAELVGDRHVFLLPEYELVIEGDSRRESGSEEGDGDDGNDDSADSDEDSDSDGERAEKRRRAEAARIVADQRNEELAAVGENELMQFALGDTDTCFAAFKRTIDKLPDQVVRYDRHGSPLWISAKNRLPEASVPVCPLCGGQRTFEFQIMPQMLNTIKSEAFDWGIITVYTCGGSCDVQGAYVPEYCHKQDVV